MDRVFWSSRRTAFSLLASGALVFGAGSVVIPAAATAAAPARLAPVLGAASDGGPVIVWLRDQHSSLNLRTQATQRIADAHADQKPLLDDITAHGGTDILQLVSLNAVSATVSKAEVARLRTFAAVKEIIPDPTLTIGDPQTTGPHATGPTILDQTDADQARQKDGESTDPNPFTTANSCGTQSSPLIEPEALSVINAPAMTDNGLSTEPGAGVIVANAGISLPTSGDLVGNQNFVRPMQDGGGTVVVGATSGDTTNNSDGEYYGDASSIDAQGTQVYQYSNELPFANLPTTCYFKIVGDAPGASLVDSRNIAYAPSVAGDASPDSSQMTEAQEIAQIDAVVTKTNADVMNESYGYANTPGSYSAHYAANDAAVAAGITVVVSSGDSGSTGTVSSPATDPQVIAAGATNTLRLNAMASGFTGWVNNDITPLSSGGTSPNNKLVDLVAPGYGGEAACSEAGTDCPEPEPNTASANITFYTEAFGGTSEAAPLVAGAAADVISTYRSTHNGTTPSPALVKELLTSTATDVDAPADEQGAGMVNIQAAMAAATAVRGGAAVVQSATSLLASPTQLDVTGAGGSQGAQTVSVTNLGATTSVTGTYRSLGAQTPVLSTSPTTATPSSTVTESVSAPSDQNVNDIPVDGAPAADNISINVPQGLDRLDADMIWPDPTNNAVLSFTLVDPEGRLRQISYDYGTASTRSGTLGTVSDTQHVEVANPEAGTWTAEIKWANGRAHLQEAPNLPGTYTGAVSFRASGQNWITSSASSPVSIAAGATATIPLNVLFPNAPGDHPESVQFVAANGASTSVAVARRTLIPASGGQFTDTVTSSVGRGVGGITTYDVQVPAGQANLGLALQTPDTSVDDPMSVYLVNPSGVAVTHIVNSRSTSAYSFATTTTTPPVSAVSVNIPSPAAGVWEIDVKLNLTTSGLEFSQLVSGDLLPQAPVINDPATGSTATTLSPTVDGTGTPGDTVSVVDAAASPVCSAPVKSDGTWLCVATTQASGQATYTATQADGSANPSPVSNAVTVTIPTATSVSLLLNPQAPTADSDLDLTASLTGVADGTVITFLDGSTAIGTALASSGSAQLDLTGGLGVGGHALTASVPASSGVLGSTSPEVDVTINKNASTIAVTIDANPVVFGTAATGSIAVSGASNDSVTLTYDATHVAVPLDSAGVGTFALPVTLSVGQHYVSASYDGSDSLQPSSSMIETLTVTKVPTTIALSLTKSSVGFGTAAKATVTMTGVSSGTAVVKVGSSTIDVPIAAGIGSVSLPAAIAVGKHSVTATYAGTDTAASSASTPVTLTVTKLATKTAESIKKAKVKAGKTDSATVVVSGHAGAVYATGKVSVVATIGSTHTTKTVTLTASDKGKIVVTFALPNKVGKASVTASYAGSASFAASGSVAHKVTTT